MNSFYMISFGCFLMSVAMFAKDRGWLSLWFWLTALVAALLGDYVL